MVDPTPKLPTVVTGPKVQNVKIATSDIFVYSDSDLHIEDMASLLFEDLAGQELISMARSDMTYYLDEEVNKNQPIKNLSSLAREYSPQKMVGLQNTADQYFNTFPLEINNYIPLEGSGLDGAHVYIQKDELANQDSLIIDVVNLDLNNNERVEVEILAYEGLYDDTIYLG
jgi:hypothetical protein